jgi:hypothetical protein
LVVHWNHEENCEVMISCQLEFDVYDLMI